MVMLNEENFNTDDFDDPIRKETNFKFFKLVSEGSWSYPILIKRTKLQLKDSLLSIGLLLTDEIESYEIEQMPLEPSYSTSDISSHIDFYVSSDQFLYTRTTYSLLDYLRDIGGLFGAFNAIFGAIVFILNFNGLYQLLTSTMFRV